jgi:hypothetical protein
MRVLVLLLAGGVVTVVSLAAAAAGVVALLRFAVERTRRARRHGDAPSPWLPVTIVLAAAVAVLAIGHAWAAATLIVALVGCVTTPDATREATERRLPRLAMVAVWRRHVGGSCDANHQRRSQVQGTASHLNPR